MVQSRRDWADLGFLVLLALVLVKPAAGTAVNHWLGLTACLAAALMALAVLRRRPPGFWYRRYRTPLWLLGGLALSYLGSTALHFTSYPSLLELGFRALGPLAVISLFPLLWLILDHGGGDRRLRWLVLGVLLVIEGLGALQPFAPQWVDPIRRHTVAADALPVITSLYRWHTILGTLSALIALYGMIRFFRVGGRWRLFYAVMAGIALLAGALSRSRNFLLSLLVGLGGWLLVSRQRLLLGAGVLVACLLLFHVVAWFNPKVSARYATALPYLQKLHRPATLTAKDFLPRVDDRSLSGRLRIWSRAVELWRRSPWFGLGPGVFSLESGFGRVHNTHNIFLQSLVDAGVPGLVFVAGFWVWALRRTFGTAAFPLTLAALAALCFDDFLDKSMAWVLVTTWLIHDLVHEG